MTYRKENVLALCSQVCDYRRQKKKRSTVAFSKIMTTGKKTFYCHVAKSMTTKYIYIIPSTVAFLGPWLRERKHSAVTFLCLWLWKKLCSIVTFLGLWLHIKRLKRNTVAFLGLWLWERKQSAVTFFGLWVREKLCSIVTFLGLWLRKEKRSSGSLQWSKESFF